MGISQRVILCRGQIFRDGTDGGDGIAAAVILIEFYFEYDDA